MPNHRSLLLRIGGAPLLAALLCSCGGDGGGGTASAKAAPPATSISVVTSYTSFLSSAHTTSFNVSGDCTGTATWTYGSPTAVSFEGSPALAVTQTRIRSLSGSSPSAAAMKGANSMSCA